MTRLLFFNILIILYLPCFKAIATPIPIKEVFNRIGGENKEVKNSKLNVEFKEQSLIGSKSRLWPNLSLTITGTKSDGGVPSPSTSLNTGVGGSGSGLSSQGSNSTSNFSTSDGHVTQLSLGYFLFAKNSITEDISMATNDVKSAEISESEVFESKKSQFLQVLMEWQLLNSVKPIVEEASEMILSVQKFSRSKSKMLYTREDRIKLDEKVAKIEYQKTRVLEGLDLAESAIKSLVPDITEDKIKSLPKIQVDYEIPSSDSLETLYWSQSRANIKNDLLVQNAESFQRASEWNRPWVPSIYLSTSYSHSSDFDAENTNTGGSASLLLSFNLFDGFYSQARLQQSRVATNMSENHKKIEGDKRILLIKHKRMTAQVAQAEYRVKEAASLKKYIRYRDIQNKFNRGVGTKLELAAGSMDYVQAKIEALNSLKKHQQAMLDIAVELNEWDKVNINEVN